MAASALTTFLHDLFRSTMRRVGQDQTDGQLLERFVRGGDKLALQTLVERHAPMVWGVCRRLLADHHAAEDAFQATFLVLLRKAASIHSRERLASWLYGVAHRTACKARQTAAKRHSREKLVAVLPEPPTDPPEDEFGPKLRERLDEELTRLPEKYRLVIVLCDLEGKNRFEVARQLGLREGTVGSRLARGRALLARRLSSRGLSVSSITLAALASEHTASAAVPTALLANTLKAVRMLAEGQVLANGLCSTKVGALTEGVVRAMASARLKAVGAVLVAATVAMAGGTVAYHRMVNQSATAQLQPQVSQGEDPGVDTARYGTAAGAKQAGRRQVSHYELGNSVRFCAAPAFEAVFNKQTHQWTVTGDIRADVWSAPRMLKRQFKVVIAYDPQGRNYRTVSYDPWWDRFNSLLRARRDPFSPEEGWRPVHINELGKWLQHDFQRPLRSATPITSVETITRDRRFSYGGHDLTVEITNRAVRGEVPPHSPPRGVSVWFPDGRTRTRQNILFGATAGRFLEVGAYGGAADIDDFLDRLTSPYIAHRLYDILPDGGGHPPACPLESDFVVWEIEVKDQKVIRLAIDFSTGVWRGSVRFNSLFQSAPGLDAPQ